MRRGLGVNGCVSLLVVCSVFLIAGCGDDDNLDYKLEVTETQSWPASGIGEIAVTTENGNVCVQASQDTVINAEITRRCYGRDRADAENYIGNVVVEDSVAGGVLTITAEMPDNGRSYGADIEILAPESVYVELTSVNGNVSAISTVAGASLRTTNGNIVSDSLEGSVAGQIVNGNADCDLALLGAGHAASVAITNGSAIVSVPSDVSAAFDARTTNGTVQVTGFASVNYTTNEENHKAGVIGPPPGLAAITITIVNGNGTIRAR